MHPALAVALDGLRPAQTPRDLVSGTLGWRQSDWVLTATVRHTARQFEDDQNSRVLAPATTVDGYFALPLSRAVTVELRAENLFGRRIEAGISGANIVERATPADDLAWAEFSGRLNPGSRPARRAQASALNAVAGSASCARSGIDPRSTNLRPWT